MSALCQKQTSARLAAKDQAGLYAFPSAANSRNKILATTLAFDPPSVVVLLPRSVLTVTNPWRDVLYEPLTVSPRKSMVNSFQFVKSLSIHKNLIEVRSNMRVGALNFVEAECGCKNVSTKSFLIDLLLRFWRYPLKRPDLPPVLRMPFRRNGAS